MWVRIWISVTLHDKVSFKNNSSLRQGLYILLSQGVTAIFTQALKYTCAHPRPYTYFNELGLSLPPTVDGVHLWDAYNSFPSGHTSATFALCTCLAAITPPKYKYMQVVWLIAGWLGAYSRIYLSQHFVDDVLLGALIGVLCAAGMYIVLFKKEWGNKPLFKYKR